MLTVQHPDFTRNSAEHDLMLIKLSHPQKLNDQVKLVALPNTTDDRRGEKCTVSGWGWEWKDSSEWPSRQNLVLLKQPLTEDYHTIIIVDHENWKKPENL